MTVRELINLIKFETDEASLKKTERAIQATITQLEHVGRRMSLFVTAPVIALAGAAVHAQGQLEATSRRFDAVFSDLSVEARQFATQFAKDFRIGEGTVERTLGIFQSFGRGLELSNEEASKYSKQLQFLLRDFASFNGLSLDASQQALISGLSGSTRTLKQYGIVLSEQDAHFTKGATEADKFRWRVQQIEEAMRRQGAIGAATRNLFTYTDQMVTFREQLGDLAESFGKVILPPVTRFLILINDGIEWIKNLNESVKITIWIMLGLAAVVGPLTLGLAGLFTVVKALVAFNVFLRSVALLKSSAIFLLQPQFILIAAAIVAAVAALALFVEDVVVWTQGGESLVGKLLGPWDQFAKGLKEIFLLATTDLKTFFKAVGITLTDVFTEIGENLEKTKFGQIMKWITGGYLAENLAAIVGTVSGIAGTRGTLGQKLGYAAGEVGRIARYGAEGGPKNEVNVTNHVTMHLPPGTSEDHAKLVEAAAKRAFDEGMTRELQRVVDNR
jgi:hypothetical protein